PTGGLLASKTVRFECSKCRSPRPAGVSHRGVGLCAHGRATTFAATLERTSTVDSNESCGVGRDRRIAKCVQCCLGCAVARRLSVALQTEFAKSLILLCVVAYCFVEVRAIQRG